MRSLFLRRLRSGAATTAAVALAVSVLAAPSAARTAGPQAAEPAKGSIAALKADVRRTSDRLAAAVTAYQRGQQRLGALLNQKVSSQRAVEQLQNDAEQARLRVASLANALYRNPVDPSLRAALDGNVLTIFDLQYLQQRGKQTRADQRRDAEVLATQVVTAEQLLVQQDEAAAEAIRLQTRLDDDLDRLQADVSASLARLQAALTELRRRQAAAAAAAFGTGGGAGCSATLPADAVNGFLPVSALCFLATAPGHRLVQSAATAFDAMSRAFAAANGTPLCVTDSYRDYAGQVSVFQRKPNLAATPGRSLHGWGRALDLCGGIQTFGSPASKWMQANAGLFGFRHPDWAEPDGSKPEPWHWEYEG